MEDKPIPENLQKKSEELMDYHGQTLVKSNAFVLIELEKQTGKKPIFNCSDHKITRLHIKGHFNDNNLFRTNKLPENIGNLTQLANLNISYQNISRLPQSFAFLINLTQLSITSTKLKSINLPFQNFSKLEILDLQENRISSFPENIEKAPNLKKLRLDSNPIPTIPKRLGKLNSLEELNISDCKISTLPKPLKHLVKLESLNLNRNKFEHAPEFIPKLIHLRNFSIFQENPLRSLSSIPKKFLVGLPQSFLESKKLKHSNYYDKFQLTQKGYTLLENNDIDGILHYYKRRTHTLARQFIKKFLYLTDDERDRLSWESGNPELQLFRVKLQILVKSNINIPKNLRKFSEEASERVIISEINFIEKHMNIEKEIANPTMPSAHAQILEQVERSLDEAFDRLIKINPEIVSKIEQFKNITKLSILFKHGYQGSYQTNVRTVAEPKFHALKEIIIITFSNIPIPENIGNLTTLVKLEISNSIGYKNRTPMNIPTSIEKLSNIHVLLLSNLSEDTINQIPFKKFSKLEYIEINECEISSLPNSIQYLKKLKYIKIFQCKNFSLLPNWFCNLTQLEIIDISECSLQILPEKIHKLNNVRRINLSQNNGLIHISQWLKNLPKLEILNLYMSNIDWLPNSKNILHNLADVDISYNNLQFIPDFLSQDNITFLVIRGNPLRSLSNIPNYDIFEWNIVDFFREDIIGCLDLLPEIMEKLQEYPRNMIQELYEFYRKAPVKLAQQYADNPRSLTTDEQKRLAWEAGNRERQILELKLKPEDPILTEINKRLSIPVKNGLNIMK